jgi:hypothetical protein
MITPILENLIVQGLASVNHVTLGQNGVSTISVPENKSVVVTKITIQPFINPSFKNGFGMNSQLTGITPDIEETIKALLAFNSTENGAISNNSQTGNILYEMLRRGTFQIELYSSDNNNTIFTFGTDFNFVNVFQTGADPATKPLTMLLPALSERSTDCYSVHRNNVHLRLRFLNASIQQSGFLAPYKKYTVAVSDKDLNNSIPETRPNVDINSANLYFHTAAYSSVLTGNFGFYPFGIETNIESSGLKSFQGNNTITFPYLDEVSNVVGAGDGGEASFYSQSHGQPVGVNELWPYMNAFIPYINVEYVLINEKSDGQTLVNPKRYNTVTVNK